MAHIDWGAIDALDDQLDNQFDGVSVATLKAVLAVESNGKGNLLDGRPKILVERHKAWKYAQEAGLDVNALAQGNENVLGAKWDKRFYKGGAGEYDRLEQLEGLVGKEIACMATSWGLGQVLGSNHKAAGHDSVADFVDAQHRGETEQLKSMLSFIRTNKLWTHLAGDTPNWAAFARGYNGTAYRQNQYDTKLMRAHRAFCLDPQKDPPPAYKSRTNWGGVITATGTVISGAAQFTTDAAPVVTEAASNATIIINNSSAAATSIQHIWQSGQSLGLLGALIAIAGIAYVFYARWDDHRNGYK